MGNVADDGPRFRFDHAALVPPGDESNAVGMAWDAYLRAACRLERDVLASLFVPEVMDVPDLRDEKTASEAGKYVRSTWCVRWGFNPGFAWAPARETAIEAQRARTEGRPLPDSFVCTWKYVRYPKWRRPTGELSALLGMERLPREGESWNLAGEPHPFPELSGRLLSHKTYEVSSGNGVAPMPRKYAAEIGTQVVLALPFLYWEPTAETQAEARARILDQVGALLDQELNTIEQAYRAHGYETPPEKRAQEHFEWVFRYQVLGESKASIARSVARDRGKIDTPDLYRSFVGRQINGTAKLLGLTLRTP